MLKIIECPRDAMQGIPEFIPTEEKVAYINSLLEVGFDTLDFGSFVSPKAIPQMQDTGAVLGKIKLDKTSTKLLAIIANIRGAEEAAAHKEITYLGYPFSISETFQQRNTNRSIDEAYQDVKRIMEVCMKQNKELVIYISMGFGNPYGDPWNIQVAMQWVDTLSREGIKIFSLSDTVGSADVSSIHYLFSELIPAYPKLEFGAHFHSLPEKQLSKIQAAYKAGCRRFDAAMLGYGGCPMAEDELVGNSATEVVLGFLEGEGADLHLNHKAIPKAMEMASRLFSYYK